jgi:DNA repair exonuclease SbcCD ATPase subunit
MYIQELNIRSFGTLCDRTVTFSRGLNIVEGKNESGKSTLAMFIKFILYGLSGRATGSALPERKRYVSWSTGQAAGSMTVADGEKLYRVERTLTLSSHEGQRELSHETVQLFNARTNAPIPLEGSPGEVLFGVPESIFLNTVFVRQIDGTRPSGASLLTSIENLLFSADENVCTEKAVERLDAARRQILYKNGSGGSLYARRAERSEAAAALCEAQEKNASLLRAEEECKTAAEEADALRERIRRQERLCECGEINLLKRRFDALGAMERKLGAMDKTLAEKTSGGIDREYLGALAACEDRLREETEEIGKLHAAAQALAVKAEKAKKTAEKIRRDADDAEAEASVLRSRIKRLGAAAGTLLVCAVLVGGGAWLLDHFDVFPSPIPLAVAGVLAILGVICLILRRRDRTALEALLREWDAVDADGLRYAVAQSHGGMPEAEKLADELQFLSAAEESAVTKQVQDAQHARTLVTRVLGEGDAAADIEAVRARLGAARAQGEVLCAETEALQKEAETLRGRYSILTEQLSGTDEALVRRQFADNIKTEEGRIASGMDAAKVEEAKKELAALRRAGQEAEQKRHALETRLAAQRAVSVSPARLAARVAALDEEIDALSSRHEAYCLAIDMLNEAAGAMREQVLPEIVADACASANRISDGAFEAIGVDRALSMSFTRGGRTYDVEYLSEGTKDVAYISLRRALSDVLFGGKRPPLLYDESFARVDEERLTRILDMLGAPSEEDAQSILFTCRSLEGTLASAAGARIVKL